MRENRTSGSEGGAAQPNASSLPLSDDTKEFRKFIMRDSITKLFLIWYISYLSTFHPVQKESGDL